MKTKLYIYPFVLLLCACGPLFGADQQVVVPNGLGNLEGNSSVSDPFNSQSFRFQQVFDASQFAFLGAGTARIDRIAFRIDGATTNNPLLFFGGSSVVLSTTQKNPDGLSGMFSDNRGGDATPVFSGAISFGGLSQADASPQAFHETVIATSPFFYIPSRGNLLLEIAGVAGQVFESGSLDAEFVTGDSVSRVFANSNLVPSGTKDSIGLITQFEFAIVPEPSTWAMTALGFSALMGARLLKHARMAVSQQVPKSHHIATSSKALTNQSL